MLSLFQARKTHTHSSEIPGGSHFPSHLREHLTLRELVPSHFQRSIFRLTARAPHWRPSRFPASAWDGRLCWGPARPSCCSWCWWSSFLFWFIWQAAAKTKVSMRCWALAEWSAIRSWKKLALRLVSVRAQLSLIRSWKLRRWLIIAWDPHCPPMPTGRRANPAAKENQGYQDLWVLQDPRDHLENQVLQDQWGHQEIKTTQNDRTSLLWVKEQLPEWGQPSIPWDPVWPFTQVCETRRRATRFWGSTT